MPSICSDPPLLFDLCRRSFSPSPSITGILAAVSWPRPFGVGVGHAAVFVDGERILHAAAVLLSQMDRQPRHPHSLREEHACDLGTYHRADPSAAAFKRHTNTKWDPALPPTATMRSPEDAVEVVMCERSLPASTLLKSEDTSHRSQVIWAIEDTISSLAA